jgi:hypothetical protein
MSFGHRETSELYATQPQGLKLEWLRCLLPCFKTDLVVKFYTTAPATITDDRIGAAKVAPLPQ